jgi:hypothetical protein
MIPECQAEKKKDFSKALINATIHLSCGFVAHHTLKSCGGLDEMPCTNYINTRLK